jgi:hypothetical protein
MRIGRKAAQFISKLVTPVVARFRGKREQHDAISLSRS